MAVLKQSHGAIRPLAAPAAAAVEDEAVRLRAEIAALRSTAAQAADAATTAIAEARAAGFAEGRKAGVAAVERSERERVEILTKAIAAEAKGLAERLAALDGLVAALARACLERVFARPEAMAAMVADTLALRLGVLRDRTGLTIWVSGADFADPAALAAPGAAVTIDPDLPSGACRMAVRLGQIDLDLPGQWATIAQALDEMAGA